MKKLLLPIIMFVCLIMAGCSNEEMKSETVTVTNSENVELLRDNASESVEGHKNESAASKEKADSSSKNNIEIKTLTKEDFADEAEYREYTDEDGKVVREIYTNNGANFEITAPDGMVIYSMISVKNVMSEDGKHGGAVTPYINLKQDDTFEFVFGSTDEYKRKGTYLSDDKTLTLLSDEGTYVFDYKENGMISFNPDASDAVPLENENAYEINKEATFIPMSLSKSE